MTFIYFKNKIVTRICHVHIVIKQVFITHIEQASRSKLASKKVPILLITMYRRGAVTHLQDVFKTKSLDMMCRYIAW